MSRRRPLMLLILLLLGGACHRPVPLPRLEEGSSEAERARQLTRAGRPLEAFEKLGEIIRRRPGDLAAHRWYVEAASESGRLAQAEEHYRRHGSVAGSGLERYGLGLIEAARGNLKPALEHLGAAAQAMPQEAEPPYRMGLLQMLAADNEAAAQSFAMALARQPEHCESRAAQGEALLRLGRREQALDVLRPLLELDCSARALEQGRAVAGRAFDPARDSEPDARPDLDRVMELLQQDLVQQALSLVDKVLERFSRDSLALSLRGIAHSRLENFGEAITAFEEALRLQPDNLPALLGLGDIYFRLERWEKARGYYEEAARRNPLDPAVCQRLGDLAGAKREHQLAARWYGRVVKLAPQDLAARHQYALALFQAGSLLQAIAVYEENLGLKPDDLESLVRLGSLYSALSRTEAEHRQERRQKAIMYLKEAKRLAPENQAVREMLEKIEEGK